MTTLQDLSATFEQARQAGELTLTAGSSGAPDLDAFLGTTAGRSLTLREPSVELQDSEQPATLTVSGAMTGTWWLPGLTAMSLTTQSAIVTYTQDGQAGPVTAALEVTATLVLGAEPVTLTGSLGPGSILSFTWQRGDQGSLSLADAVAAVTDGRAAEWVPVAESAFSALELSALTVAVGYTLGGSTTVTLTLDAQPDQAWQVLSGRHVLRQIGVSLVSSYQATGAGPLHGFGGSVHAILDLGQEIGVSVALTTGSVWEIELDDSGGLPAIGTVAAIAGAQTEVQAGLAAIGLGDIALRSVRIGIDRADMSLAYISIQGAVTVAGVTIDAGLQLPEFSFGGMLDPLTPVSLSALLHSALGGTGGLPDIQVSLLSLMADPRTGDYTVLIGIEDGALAAGGYGLSGVALELTKQSTGMTGAISAGIAVAGANFFVTGTYGPGWLVSGQLDRLDLGKLIAEVLAEVELPSPLAGLELTNVSASWDLATSAFSFSGQVAVDIQAGPRALATTLTLAVDSQVRSGSRTTTAELTGSLSIGAMDFSLRYQFVPGQQVLTGTWDAHGQASLAGLAGAFGMAVPGGGVSVPELDLTGMSFTIDWSRAGEQAFQVTAATSAGEAFFVVARPQPGQLWAFAFGAAIDGTTRLSQVLGRAGLTVTELDFITLAGAAFLVASAPFPSLQVPGFTALSGLPMPVSQGVTAAVLLDLAGSPARPDVTTLKTVLSGGPPVLLGEMTLSTSITAIALTVRLAGTLSITGPGGTSVTLTDVSLVLKPDPVALTLQGSAGFPLGSTPVVATGLLTVAANEVTGALNIQGQNGQVLPFPMGYPGVHLTDIGVEIGVGYEPPSLTMGLLGRFVLGPGPALPLGQVQARSLAAVPPPNEFVLILGLEGEVPNPLLLSMYLQQLSLGTAVEAFTNLPPARLPALLNLISASDVMIYWCDAPAGLQLPDGTWAYPGYGLNAVLDIYGVHAYAELKINAASGITGNACIDPLSIAGVIGLTGNGKGTSAAYAGQVTVRPGGAEIEVSTSASPYLTIDWQVTLFGAVTQSVNAQLTSSGFMFAIAGSAYGFTSALTCVFQTSGRLSMAFTAAITADISLGTLNGVRLGSIRLAHTALTCSLTATAAPSLSIAIDASFEFAGKTLTMPALTASTTYSSLEGIPAAIAQHIEDEAAAIFAGFTLFAAQYLSLARNGLVTGADETSTVLKAGYGQTQAEAAAAMNAAGYDVDDAGKVLTAGWDATSGEAGSALKSAGYSVRDTGTYLKGAFNLGPDALHSALESAGYASSDIGTLFHSLGGSFAGWASSNLDPRHW